MVIIIKIDIDLYPVLVVPPQHLLDSDTIHYLSIYKESGGKVYEIKQGRLIKKLDEQI